MMNRTIATNTTTRSNGPSVLATRAGATLSEIIAWSSAWLAIGHPLPSLQTNAASPRLVAGNLAPQGVPCPAHSGLPSRPAPTGGRGPVDRPRRGTTRRGRRGLAGPARTHRAAGPPPRDPRPPGRRSHPVTRTTRAGAPRPLRGGIGSPTPSPCGSPGRDDDPPSAHGWRRGAG